MVQNFNENLKFIPRGLPRDKAMGDYQGGEAQLSLFGIVWGHTSGEYKHKNHAKKYSIFRVSI